MRHLLSMIFLVVISITGHAQLDSYDFHDDTRFKMSLRYGRINTLGVSEDSVKDISALLIRFLEYDKINHQLGGYNTSHRWATVPEAFVLAVIDALNGGGFEWGSKNTSTSIGDFILGWHNHAWSAVYTGDFSLSAGLYWGDYFLGYEPFARSSRSYEAAEEPAGWYGALGPAVMADYNVADLVVVHFEGSYGLTMKFSDFPDMNPDEAYPDPHFLNLNLQIRSNSFLYGGFEHIRSINRGDNPFNATRTDFFIGAWF